MEALKKLQFSDANLTTGVWVERYTPAVLLDAEGLGKTKRSNPITCLMMSVLKYYDASQTGRWCATDKSDILFHPRHSKRVLPLRYFHLSHIISSFLG
jgi:hypothetical protein